MGSNQSVQPKRNKMLYKGQEIDWTAAAFLAFMPVIAIGGTFWYAWENGVHWMDITLFVGLYLLSGLSITAGYHRCFSHKAYESHPILQFFYLVFGAIAIQHTALKWSRNHRIHHQCSDTELDPHNVKEGFFHSHMGWIIRKTPLDLDFSGVSDLKNNKLVMWQHRYYWWIALGVGLGLPMALGALVDRPIGGLVWGALLRVFLQSHATYSINSIAHTWGRQPFSLKNEARDSWLLALISNGEGFHNFHHRFASDYRNGWKWYHWDPSKWLIKTGSYLGLTKNLKSASDSDLVKAQMAVQMQKLKKQIAEAPLSQKATLEERLQAARKQVEVWAARWAEIKEQYRAHRRKLRWDRSEREKWRSRLQDAKREFKLAQANWAKLAATTASAAAVVAAN